MQELVDAIRRAEEEARGIKDGAQIKAREILEATRLQTSKIQRDTEVQAQKDADGLIEKTRLELKEEYESVSRENTKEIEDARAAWAVRIEEAAEFVVRKVIEGFDS